ncbi:MAG: IPT/TIG domain-containing protein, partial [Bacteroidia bacterium]
MKNPSYRIISLILLLTGVVFAQQHQGSNCLLVEVPLTTQVGLADIIIEGEVTYDTAAWNSSHTMILSRYLLKVHSVLKGSKVPSTLPVYIEGGVVGTEKVEVHPSPRMIEGEKGIFFLAKKATNPYTASATNKAYTLPAGPQSVMRYDLLRNEVHYPFGIHRGIKGFVGQVSRISGLYQNRGTSNFYKAANLQPRIQGQKNVLRFSPTTITAGTKSILTIQGTNFGTQTGRIHFRNANAGGGQVITLATDIVSWTNTQIEVYVPSGAGSGNFEVVTGSATFVSPGAITVPYNHLNPGTNRQDYMGRLVDYGGGKLSWQYSASIAANLPARASFERALETWRCQTFINWDISAQNTTATGQARDNINGVFFSQLPPGVLGVCWSYYNSCQIGGNPAYYTSELDIAFSPNFTWQYGPALPAANEFDFETVALHELGHGHQLGHIINNPAPM